MRAIFQTFIQFDNLYEAHRKARRGKRSRREVIEYEMDLAQNLYRLQAELQSGIYRMKPYKRFTIYDPKERHIFALSYRDRIVQHSLCDNLIQPFMERHLIYDNAASRIGKGTHFAMDRLSHFMRKYYKRNGTDGYFLKYDVKKYYDSIDHEILFQLFHKVFSDEQLLALVKHIIDSYETVPGKGIPLGNQTSSWFALYYLDGLDRLIKEKFRIKYYTRYMDDGILIHSSKLYLKACLDEMRKYAWWERGLVLNEKTQIIPLSQGVDYLGFHFYLTDTGKVIRRLRTSNKKRLKRKLKHYQTAYQKDAITMDAVTRSLISYRGHLSHGHTYKLQKHILKNFVLSKETIKPNTTSKEDTHEKQQSNQQTT